MIAARGIEVSFGGVRALGGATVEVGAGEIVGLIGPNGAGKTTLINVMTGMVAPHAGRVELDGADVTGTAPHVRARRGLRRMFQHGGLVPDESAITNVVIAQHAVNAGARRERALGVLADLGVAQAAGVAVRDLPAGTARLVELACVLVGEPKVMLLDEPSAGLDAAETDLLGRVVSEQQRRRACATLVVAHDMRFVMSLVDRAVVLADGEVLVEGTPQQVQADERVRRLYLGAA